MVYLLHFYRCLCFSIALLFADGAQATINRPVGDALQEASLEGRSPSCYPPYQDSPPLEECKEAVRQFTATIYRRGFSLSQTIEFLEPGTPPLFPQSYPRQPLTSLGKYHVFTGNAVETCILMFYFVPGIPSQPASAISTYGDFLAGARVVIDACVTGGTGGWMRLRTEGWDIAVAVHAGNIADPEYTDLVVETADYQVPAADKAVIPDPSSAQVVPPTAGDSGEGSSTGPGTVQGQAYCNTQQNPSTCEAGSSCQAEQDAADEEEAQWMVLWGVVAMKLMDMIGTCAELEGGPS